MSQDKQASSSTQSVIQTTEYPTSFPPQHQDQQPGSESQMNPHPQHDNPRYRGSGKLEGKVAVITGGDSGIGRAVAIAFAKEGANVGIIYLNEHDDAEETAKCVSKYNRECVKVATDVGDPEACKQAVQEIVNRFGQVDVLVNAAAEQHPQQDILDITPNQLQKTFQTNVFGYFYMIQAVLPHMKAGASIVNTTSITAYHGSPQLIDYSATKGAIVALIRSLSGSLVKKGIRVNGVAPGPIWTPLIPSTFTEDQVSKFGSDSPMQRAGQPCELAPAYVYLASEDSSYVTGQVIHVNGGSIING